MVRISSKQVDRLIEKYRIDTKVVPKATLMYAIKVEMEHGRKFGVLTNITNDIIELTLRIALAHLIEYPNYYEYLSKMESKLTKYWTGRTKPSIIIRKNKL